MERDEGRDETHWCEVREEAETYIEAEASTMDGRKWKDEGREKTAATETPQRAINKFDTRVGKLAKLPASGVSI